MNYGRLMCSIDVKSQYFFSAKGKIACNIKTNSTSYGDHVEHNGYFNIE